MIPLNDPVEFDEILRQAQWADSWWLSRSVPFSQGRIDMRPRALVSPLGMTGAGSE
jgi:hypothetical protein